MPSDVRLTRAQKWDLVRMSGAAVVSTIFFGVPMFVARPDVERSVVPVAVDAPAQSAAAAAQLPVAIVVSDAVAPVATPMLETTAATSGRVPPAARRAAAPQMRSRAIAPSTRPLARKLARFLAGSGRYEVRPFPTPGTSGS